MKLFWSHGYERPSFDQLVKTTGASRHGLYQDFGGKRSLLLKSLQHYEATVLAELLGELEHDEAGIGALEEFFRRVSVVARTDRSGCFMCNSHVELADDAEVSALTASFFRRLKRLFVRCLERSRDCGELDRTADLDRLANYLVGFVRGISVNARAPLSRSAYEAYVDTGLLVF